MPNASFERMTARRSSIRDNETERFHRLGGYVLANFEYHLPVLGSLRAEQLTARVMASASPRSN